jgi:hypothetical protein
MHIPCRRRALQRTRGVLLQGSCGFVGSGDVGAAPLFLMECSLFFHVREKVGDSSGCCRMRSSSSALGALGALAAGGGKWASHATPLHMPLLLPIVDQGSEDVRRSPDAWRGDPPSPFVFHRAHAACRRQGAAAVPSDLLRTGCLCVVPRKSGSNRKEARFGCRASALSRKRLRCRKRFPGTVTQGTV